jgi:hypothetical protein
VPVLLTSMPVFAAANANYLKQSPDDLGSGLLGSWCVLVRHRLRVSTYLTSKLEDILQF